jgi:hypothetical protein
MPHRTKSYRLYETDLSLASFLARCLCGLCDLSVLCESNWATRALDVTLFSDLQYPRRGVPPIPERQFAAFYS